MCSLRVWLWLGVGAHGLANGDYDGDAANVVADSRLVTLLRIAGPYVSTYNRAMARTAVVDELGAAKSEWDVQAPRCNQVQAFQMMVAPRPLRGQLYFTPFPLCSLVTPKNIHV